MYVLKIRHVKIRIRWSFRVYVSIFSYLDFRAVFIIGHVMISSRMECFPQLVHVLLRIRAAEHFQARSCYTTRLVMQVMSTQLAGRPPARGHPLRRGSSFLRVSVSHALVSSAASSTTLVSSAGMLVHLLLLSPLLEYCRPKSLLERN